MKIDKDAVGALIAMVGLALCTSVGVMTVFFTKWREYAPLVREWLIALSVKAHAFSMWLDRPQFWIGVCFTLFCAVAGLAAFAIFHKDEL